MSLTAPPFELQRPKVLQFCFYRASVRSQLRLVALKDGTVSWRAGLDFGMYQSSSISHLRRQTAD